MPGLAAAQEPTLVPEVSQREINIQYGFTGAELLLFGALVAPGSSSGKQTDIVVVLKGPVQPIIVREKQQIAGIWVNAESTEFRSAPGYFAVASSRPIADIVDDKTAAIYELGLDYLQLSPAGSIDPEEQRRFTAGLVDLKSRGGLYGESGNSVTISESVLYQARIQIPSSVPVGTYTAETFLIQDARVLAAAVREVEIRKFGFEGFLAWMAEDMSFIYGLAAVTISLLFGWAAGNFFRRD
ncbi:TIGR02186 family protein [Sphingorhabdus sp. Alg239-R122]|uniref:TIGR02186 family protein n=1 Tax=Sphingorhabdus sp. Alg239-R122 TaxID=2305989 RepID=UPI001F077119|nr:TIGR02186 family protein [Sphingorhabdus sp. Alg239-R122]